MQNYVFFFVVTLVAYTIKGMTGFGNTLVMSPLFALKTTNRVITPIDLLLSLPTNSVLVWKNRHRLNLRRIAPLALLLLAGVIPGTMLLKSGNDSLLKIFLGVTVIGLAFEISSRKEVYSGASKAHPALLAGAGLFSGVLAGLYGITAPLVAYISRTSDGRSEFRANLCALFLIDNVFRLGWYLWAGLFTRDVLSITAVVLPAALGGLFLGGIIDRYMSDALSKKLMFVLLLGSGLTLIIRNL